MGYQCFHCLTDGVRWCGDFDSDDYGFEEPGIIHELECDGCGARITYFVPIPDEENDMEEKTCEVIKCDRHMWRDEWETELSCGHRVAELEGNFDRCPVCGARVVYPKCQS